MEKLQDYRKKERGNFGVLYEVNPDRKHQYRRPYPKFSKPSYVGCFSLDGERNFKADRRNLKYLRLPRKLHSVKYNLNAGVNEVIRKSDFVCLKGEKIDHILRFILKNSANLIVHEEGKLQRLSADVVCFRGLLTTLCGTPYDRDGWIVTATRFRGTLYLRMVSTEKAVQEYHNQTNRQKTMCSWGFKFEQYLMTENPEEEPNTSSPVNENEEFCVMMRTTLESHRLLFGAELDGLDPTASGVPSPERLNPDHFVELKTSKICENWKVERTLRKFKFIKWFLQSYFSGCPKIIAGFRDDNGVVRKLEVLPTFSLPKQAEEWEAEVCLNYCVSFLSALQGIVTEDDPRVVYRFEYVPAQPIRWKRLPVAGDFQILPEWYLNQVFSDVVI